ncbi:MAG TPA: hypothetical protein VKX45_19450 [Bryobacteraceae bacterium]|jgi:hypothetical protein|nr:hypothetical protein [Bryobacteraceae bacterium]
MACAICEIRRPRRFCPGVRGDICSICCGTEREMTVDCPLDCEYLAEARRHEKPQPLDEAQIPNRDIEVTERFLEQREDLLAFLGRALAEAAFATPGAVDFDVRDALAGLIRTYRTLESGVYYESVPANALAANIYRLVQEAAARYRQEETRRLGVSRTRDADVLGILVFFERLELDRNNGRRRGRAFLDMLRQFYAGEAREPEPSRSPLILP